MASQKHPDPRNQDGDFSSKHWTDGFPHDFHGWGPQTPIPDNELPQGKRVKLKVRDELTWHADWYGKDKDHIIWRYDGARQ